MISQLITGIKYVIKGPGPQGDVTQVPFGPGQPLQPVFQEGMEGRQFDYQTYINMNYVPRSEEPIGFFQLRGLADGCDIMRLGLETVKDEICKISFTILPIDE